MEVKFKNKYSNIKTCKCIKVDKKLREDVIEAYVNGKYGDIIKHVVDFYDEFIDKHYERPYIIDLQNLEYIAGEGQYDLGGENFLLGDDCADTLARKTAEYYKYKGQLYRFKCKWASFNEYWYHPMIICMGCPKAEEIE